MAKPKPIPKSKANSVAAPARSKRGKSIPEDVTDVVSKRDDATFSGGEVTEPQAILTKIRARERANADDATIARLTSVGAHIYTPEELNKRFGVNPDAAWTQERIQWIGEVGEFIFPIVKLSKKAKEIDAKYIVPGRREVKKLIATAYALFVNASSSQHSKDIFQQLRGRLASDGATVHKDTPDASVVIRSVFEKFNSKQVHTYGKALSYAQEQKIQPDKFVSFVSDEGGFEKIRTKALKHAKKIGIEDTARVEKHNHAQIEKILEFRRTEPLIQLELTMQQHLELKPNVTVSKPDKNMEMVVLLAEMDPYDFEKCNIYGTVPMTAALRKGLLNALSEFKIFDSAFATRYYAWLDKQPSENPKETARERMNKRATALVEKSKKKAAAKGTSRKATASEKP